MRRRTRLYYQQTLNNFVNFDFDVTKLSGIDPYEKRIDYPGGHAWEHVFMACSKLVAMAIYLVKQACGNDKRACVYHIKSERNWKAHSRKFFSCTVLNAQQEHSHHQSGE